MTAVDAFADQQTVALSEKTIVVDYDWRGFNAQALIASIRQLDLSQFAGFVYGSGFEAQPELLQKIADIIPLIGNSPETIFAVKNASMFFATLRELNILHPGVHNKLPADDGYIRKFAGGSGGVHIRPANADEHYLPENHYYQQKIDGYPVSLLFIANGREIEVIGFNEQWLDPSDAMPFRYGGAAGQARLSQEVRRQLISAAEKLTAAFGLLGLNSLDALLQKDMVRKSNDRNALDAEQVYILEINPRLSATVDLYDSVELDLFDRHVQTCLHRCRLPPQGSAAAGDIAYKRCKANAIVYAGSDMEIHPMFAWPDWVVDNPPCSGAALKILAGEPVCTVIAYADNADDAKKLAQNRVKTIQNLLQSKK